jgi:hypothetical protein
MRTFLHRSLLQAIVLLQACSLVPAGVRPGALAGPVEAARELKPVPVEHVESVACRDSATGIEFAPLGVCFDVTGTLYVVDSDDSRIYVASSGTGALELFSECPSEYPDCDFIDLAGGKAGNIYVSERSGGAILELDRWGELGALAVIGEGLAGIGGGPAGRVFAAMGITGSISMVEFDMDVEALETVIRSDDVNAYPVDCHMLGEKTVVVTDAAARQVLFLSSLGNVTGAARGFAFESPFGVTCIGSRLVLAADSGRGVVAVFDGKGDFLYTFGEGILDTPTFLDSTPDGLVCVSDVGRMTIEVFEIGEVAEQ